MPAFPYPAHPLTPYPPLIVNVAPTGIVPSRRRDPHVPLTASEIVDDAARCAAAGASVVHVHVRDAEGRPAWRREAYAEVIGPLRRRCPGIVVCATTSGRAGASLDQRTDVLALEGDERPDMASLTLGSVNFPGGTSVNDLDTIDALATRMAERGVRPELEIFDLGMAHLAQRLVRRGLLHGPAYANLMLGFPNGAPADARALVALVDALPAEITAWGAGGFGAFQLPAGALAAAAGGHVRTGLEDNPHLDHETRAPATNPALVERAVAQARAAGRRVATPTEARAILGLPIPAPAPAAG